VAFHGRGGVLAPSGAGCLLWGLGSSLHADETPRDAPPVPGAVEECPTRSDVRVMATPRGEFPEREFFAP